MQGELRSQYTEKPWQYFSVHKQKRNPSPTKVSSLMHVQCSIRRWRCWRQTDLKRQQVKDIKNFAVPTYDRTGSTLLWKRL